MLWHCSLFMYSRVRLRTIRTCCCHAYRRQTDMLITYVPVHQSMETSTQSIIRSWKLWMAVGGIVFGSLVFIFIHETSVALDNNEKSRIANMLSSNDCSFVKGWFVDPEKGQWFHSKIYEIALQHSKELKCQWHNRQQVNMNLRIQTLTHSYIQFFIALDVKGLWD